MDLVLDAGVPKMEENSCCLIFLPLRMAVLWLRSRKMADYKG